MKKEKDKEEDVLHEESLRPGVLRRLLFLFFLQVPNQ